MIKVLVEYGSALYWALLFFGIYIVTVFAETRTNTLRPNLWAGLLAFFLFGFTDYNPDTTQLGSAALVYFGLGTIFVVIKWTSLVVKVRDYTDTLREAGMDCWTVRHFAYEQFQPNNATDGVMTLPPEPYEFRTRLWLWFMYWPSFTCLRFLCVFHKKAGNFVWKQFSKVSQKIYENHNRP